MSETIAPRRRIRERVSLILGARRKVLTKLLRPSTIEELDILATNQALRLSATHKPRAAMGLELSIPYRHLQAIEHMIPELKDNHGDRESRRKAWALFMRDPLCRPYKVS